MRFEKGADAAGRRLLVADDVRHRLLLRAEPDRPLRARASATSFVTNPDGSVDIYIQAESPGKDKEANWLPAPKGKFELVLRMYGPKKTPPTIVDGSWTPPPVKQVP